MKKTRLQKSHATVPLSTMTLKFSVNFEEYLLKSSGTYVYKIKMAPAILHNPFKGNVQ